MRGKIDRLWANKENRATLIQVSVGSSLLALLMIGSISLIYTRLAENARISHENQGYIRYTACVVNVGSELETTIVPDEVSEACWQKAEHETGIKLVRYSETVLLNK